MLIGEYEGKLTDKNRLAIPKKIREELKGNMVLSRGYEGCLILLDAKLWQVLEKTINKKPILSLSVRDMKRFIMGSAYEIEVDDQGRFVLPNNLKEFGSIDKTVYFVGLMDWVEIWAENKWKAKINDLSKNATDIAEQFLKKNGY
jgi:MraZ protein